MSKKDPRVAYFQFWIVDTCEIMVGSRWTGPGTTEEDPEAVLVVDRLDGLPMVVEK